jgi:hypothetical protein
MAAMFRVPRGREPRKLTSMPVKNMRKRPGIFKLQGYKLADKIKA